MEPTMADQAQPAPDPREQSPPPNQAGLLLVISGPSGAGKSTIAHHVENALGGRFSVSVTTRPKGPGEVDGRDYHFIDDDRYNALRDAGQLLEAADVFDHHYGTPRQPVEQALDAGQLIILEIDVQGAIQVKHNMPQMLGLFILPPSEDQLLTRLRERKRDSEQVIQRRFAKAKQEIAAARDCGVYDHFLVNDDLERAKTQAVDLVRQAWANASSTP